MLCPQTSGLQASPFKSGAAWGLRFLLLYQALDILDTVVGPIFFESKIRRGVFGMFARQNFVAPTAGSMDFGVCGGTSMGLELTMPTPRGNARRRLETQTSSFHSSAISYKKMQVDPSMNGQSATSLGCPSRPPAWKASPTPLAYNCFATP